MNSLYHLIWLLSLITIVNCQIEEKDGIVYCRVCGSIIANTSNIIIKEAEERDFSNEVENQESNVHIHYDSFESSKVWKGKKLVYFSQVGDDVSISTEKQVCPHFDNHYFSPLTCSHCNSMIGYVVEEDEETEEETEESSDLSSYEEEDIVELLNIHEDGIENQLKEVFVSQQPPTITVGYWSYEYHHHKEIFQYHNKIRGNPNDVDLKWSLGKYDDQASGIYGMDMTVQPPIPYYAYFFKNGQMCDEIHSPRETELRFEPCENKKIASIRSVDEVSICKYIIRVCVPSLKKKMDVRKNAFYALSIDDVLFSSDKILKELKEDPFEEKLKL